MKPLKNVPASLTMDFAFHFVMGDSGRTYNFSIPATSEAEAQKQLSADLDKMRAVFAE